MNTSDQLLDKINLYIDRLDYSHYPESLYAPVKYVLSLGGKRIRPILMMMAYELYQQDVENILSQAAGIEIYHNFTLLHDDLMDKADLRRGNQTVHIKWNENKAILSGDAMTVLAYRYLLTNNKTVGCLHEIVQVFNQTALEICEGQELDMEFEHRKDVSEVEYIEMIRLKTAVLLACALKIGAILGGADSIDAALLYDCGIQMGLAFQLQDDFLDVYGNIQSFGKKIGGDILCNKKTFLLIKAMEVADVSDAVAINKWMSMSNCKADDKIAAVTKIYTDLNIPSLCKEKIDMYYNKGMESLNRVSIFKDKKKILAEYIRRLMVRNI